MTDLELWVDLWIGLLVKAVCIKSLCTGCTNPSLFMTDLVFLIQNTLIINFKPVNFWFC